MTEYEQLVKVAVDRYQQTRQAHEDARRELSAAIVKALKGGARPTDVTVWSPFTATYVRKLARRAGVDARPILKAGPYRLPEAK